MTESFTAFDLQAFMDHREIRGEVLFLDVPTPTVEAAAQAVGVKPQQIVKSVLFCVLDQSVLTISCGDQLVERRVIGALYGVSRKRVKLANPEKVLELTGYAVGTVPPFGHREDVRTLLDPRVLDFSEVYAGGGSHNALIRLDPQEIRRITQAEIIDLHNRPS
jgi:prolyl-tRNA editing enzyme YbaK/EbsC (Cys-tRNA(Pro) deacylase)